MDLQVWVHQRDPPVSLLPSSRMDFCAFCVVLCRRRCPLQHENAAHWLDDWPAHSGQKFLTQGFLAPSVVQRVHSGGIELHDPARPGYLVKSAVKSNNNAVNGRMECDLCRAELSVCSGKMQLKHAEKEFSGFLPLISVQGFSRRNVSSLNCSVTFRLHISKQISAFTIRNADRLLFSLRLCTAIKSKSTTRDAYFLVVCSLVLQIEPIYISETIFLPAGCQGMYL